MFAYLVGIALPFPGFCGTLGAKVSVPAQNLGHLGWMISFTSSFIVYYLVTLVWPTQNQKLVREMGLKWEEQSYREIVAVDGTVIPAELEGYGDARLSVSDEKSAGHVVGEDESPDRK